MDKISSDYIHANIFTPECRFLLWAGTTAASHVKFQTGRATNNITSRSRKNGTEKTVSIFSRHLDLSGCKTMGQWVRLAQAQARQKTLMA
jgi:hypothetical protein